MPMEKLIRLESSLKVHKLVRKRSQAPFGRWIIIFFVQIHNNNSI